MALAPRTVQNMPGLLEPAQITVLHPSFDHTGPHEKSLLTELGIAHPLFVPFEIVRFGLQGLRQTGVGASPARAGRPLIFRSCPWSSLFCFTITPTPLGRHIVGIELASYQSHRCSRA